MTMVDDDRSATVVGAALADDESLEPALEREAPSLSRATEPDGGVVGRVLLPAARVVIAACVVMLVWIVGVAPLAHLVTQKRLEADLRGSLNMATVPVRTPAPAGEPLAFLEIESIGLRRVVLAGTTADVLADGPGHLRTSRLPGQAGTSVIIGRRSLFGGDFSDLDEVTAGDVIVVTTGQGTAEYRVDSVRSAPATETEAFIATGNHLLLMTAGSSFSASDRLVVDAVLVGEPVPSGSRVAQSTPGATELGLDGDRGGLAALVAWSQVWLIALVATAWMAIRWRPRATWVLAAPVHLALATLVAEQIALLLPPLL